MPKVEIKVGDFTITPMKDGSLVITSPIRGTEQVATFESRHHGAWIQVSPTK